MVQLLEESASSLRKADSATWKITLITPGKGSSGTYSESMLRESAARAFPAGTHSYVDHPRNGEQRNPRDLIGVLAEAATYEDGVGIVGKLKVFPHYSEFIENVGPHIGMSIFAAGEGHEEAGEYIVDNLIADVSNSIDAVSYAGRGGQVTEKLLESARSAVDTKKTSTEVVAEKSASKPAAAKTPRIKETKGMEDELVTALSAKVDSLVEGLTALSGVVTTLVESQTPVEPVVEEAEIDFAQVAEQAVTAGLPAEARKVVYESVRNGKAIDDAIADQKALVESIKQEFRSAGAVIRVGESATPSAAQNDLFVGRWNN